MYYFEVKIVSKAENHKSLVGIGICNRDVPLDRLPGWDKESYGYHGDDGFFFPCSGKGLPYGPTFGSGDVVGCGINFAKRKLFFTKNGEHLGYLDNVILKLGNDYFPVIGMQAQKETAVANFGQEEFLFDLKSEQRKAYAEIKEHFNQLRLPDEKILWMNNAVADWLNHIGYSKTYESFNKTVNTSNENTIRNIELRYNYVRAIKEARLVFVIDEMEKEFEGLFKKHPELLLLLKIQKFIDRNYWSQKVIVGEIQEPNIIYSEATNTRVTTRSQIRRNSNNSNVSSPRSGTKRRNNSSSQNSHESSPRRSIRNSVDNGSNNEAVDTSNGFHKNGTTTTIVAENDDITNGDQEMEDLSMDVSTYGDLFDANMHEIYKYYEPTMQDARQIMAYMKSIGPISQGLHDLVLVSIIGKLPEVIILYFREH